ncbi:MAG TPA: UvrB/UvrC motif-containing protein [Gemmatimonadales bacterium]
MDCQQCGLRPAAIHLTQVVDNEVKTLHLCEACASDKGVETEATVAKFPLSDFLASMGKGAASALPAGADGEACSFCGGTLQDFRDTGRLGCPRCYDTFEPHLRTLLRRIHGSSRHVGHVERTTGWAGGVAGAHPIEETLVALRDRLRRAVAAENFELAAELRDQIRGIE